VCIYIYIYSQFYLRVMQKNMCILIDIKYLLLVVFAGFNENYSAVTITVKLLNKFYENWFKSSEINCNC